MKNDVLNPFSRGPASPKIQAALLCGVSVIACGIVLGRPAAAQAQTVSSSTNSTVNSTGADIYVLQNVDLTGMYGIENDALTTPTIVNFGTIVASQFGIYNNNNGVIGTLVNDGSISNANASGYAIDNLGSIGLLSNAGTILTPAFIGIYSGFGHTIASLSNIGLISARSSGVRNQGGLGTFTNTGTINGNAGFGVANDTDATISAVVNSGLITGGDNGLVNDGSITRLTNFGTITAGPGETTPNVAGIANYGGSIATLTNTASGLIQGSITGILNTANIGTLSNAGLITSTADRGFGILNAQTSSESPAPTIALLTNTGTISGAGFAIESLNGASIGTLINGASGLVLSARGTGIDNDSAYIGTLSNSGTIIGLFSGVGNYSGGTIGTIFNAGTIAGAEEDGIANLLGTIGAIYNTGTILSASSYGVHNSGVIGTLSSSGQIDTSFTAVYNSGAIGLVYNAGTISSRTDYGLNNTGSITTVTNAGLISGEYTGVINLGSIGTLSSTGSIYGNTNNVVNTGTISAFSNSGAITNGKVGVLNGGVAAIKPTFVPNFAPLLQPVASGSIIGTFYNSGLISGSSDGVHNLGTIGVFTNANTGTISATSTIGPSTSAIYNDEGTIGRLDNQGLVTSVVSAIDNGGTIGTLTNSGIVTSGATAIYNGGGTIGTLTNNGSIIGTSNGGIFSFNGTIGQLTNYNLISGRSGVSTEQATIGELSNAGSIIGRQEGIYNYDSGIGTIINTSIVSGGTFGIQNGYEGSIGTLSNTGLITGGTGIDSEGLIGSLSNSGIITGKYNGIYNYTSATSIVGVIGTLTNSGTIQGGGNGIYNADGTIGQLNNSGTIIGENDDGIYNTSSGNIATLVNSGVIQGGGTGVQNQNGSIGVISNSGTITGVAYGVNSYSEGQLGTLINSGVISGGTGIYLSGSGATTLINSGTITSFAGDAIYVSQNDYITLTTGTDIIGNIDGGNSATDITLEGHGSLTSDITNFGAGSVLAISPGADWTATGNWTIDSVFNGGTFQPGIIGTPLDLTGSYIQNEDGTLRVIVTPDAISQLSITGSASLDGKLEYLVAPGSYTPRTSPFITATGPISGTFSSVDYGIIPAGDATTTYEGDPTVNLVITQAFNTTVKPDDGSVFGAQTQALANATQQDTGSLLDLAGTGGAAASPACAAQAPLSPNHTGANGMSTSGQMASAIASRLCGIGGWIEATGALGHVDASSGAPAYNANTAGFLGGVDTVVGDAGTRLGVAIGYDETYLSDKAGGSGTMGTTHVALYASQPLGAFTLAGVAGYGYANNKTSRDTGLDNLSGKNNVNIFSAGLQLSTSVMLGGVTVSPAAGVKFASVNAVNVSESASGIDQAFAVRGKTGTYDSVRPYALAKLGTSFITSSGVLLSPEASLGLEYEAGDRGKGATIFSQDGTAFSPAYNKLDGTAALVSAGVSAAKGNASVYLKYRAELAGNYTDQIGEAGLRISF